MRVRLKGKSTLVFPLSPDRLSSCYFPAQFRATKTELEEEVGKDTIEVVRGTLHVAESSLTVRMNEIACRLVNQHPPLLGTSRFLWMAS